MEIWKKMWVGVFFLNTVYTLVNSETDCRRKRTETFAQPSCTLRCHVLQWSADLLMKLMLIRAVARVMLRNAQASQWWGVYVPLPGEKKREKMQKMKTNINFVEEMARFNSCFSCWFYGNKPVLYMYFRVYKAYEKVFIPNGDVHLRTLPSLCGLWLCAWC